MQKTSDLIDERMQEMLVRLVMKGRSNKHALSERVRAWYYQL